MTNDDENCLPDGNSKTQKLKNSKTQKLMNSKTQPDWKQILKILIAVLTAIAGTLGVASCMS